MKRIIKALSAWLILGAAPPAIAQQASAPPCVSTCEGVLGENIYPNGDFGAGTPNVILLNPNLAPGYQYQPSPPPNDGYYTITNNTTPWGWFAGTYWIDIEDNGPEPNGYFMVVNASYPPGLFFQNTVAVCENTLYEFSVDVINLFFSQYPTAIKPNLSFLIDNVVYCTTGDIPSDHAWHTMRFSFTTAPGQTSVQLAMQNNAPGGYGNDLALDNISFRACGPEFATTDTVGYCPGRPARLEAQMINSLFADPKYQWQIFTNGAWENIPGADSTVLTVSDPQDGALYRLLAASALANLDALHCRAASGEIRLVQLPPLQVSAAALDIACFGQQNGSAQALPLTGIAPYTYMWSNGSPDSLLSGLAPGVYDLVATDALGCTGAASVTVAAPDSLVATLAALPVNCFGEATGAVFASASGGTSPYWFAWDSGIAGDTLSNLPAGTYQLTLTDARGCSASGAAVVTTPPPLSLAGQVQAVSCFGLADGAASVDVSGGTPPYTFLWNTGAADMAINGGTAGAYSVTATDAQGCTRSAEFNLPEPPALSIGAAVDPVSCYNGTDGAAQTTVSGGTAPYVYGWSNGQNTAQLSGLQAGDYTLTVTDAQGCQEIVEVAVQQAPALLPAASGAAVACFGGQEGKAIATVSGGVAPYQFLWNTGQSTAQITGLPAGAYTVTVTDANGCTGIAGYTVASPAALQAQIGATHVSCFGLADGQAIATPSGGVTPYQFLWSTGQITADLTGLPAGIMSLTLTDAHGCSTTASLPILEPPLLTLAASATEVRCFGGQDAIANATASGGTLPYSFYWSHDQSGAQSGGLAAGIYTVTATDAQGCTATQVLTVYQPPPLVSISGVQAATCFGGNDGTAWVEVDGGQAPYQYLWNHGAATAQLGNLSAGSYAVTITDARACTLTASLMVTQPPALNAQVAATPVVCNGQSNGSASVVVSGGTPPLAIQWSNQQSTTVITSLPAGAYALTVVDAQGCTLSATVTVNEPPPLSGIAQVQELSCFGDANGAAALILSGGTAPYSYYWQNGYNGHSLQPIPAGVYAVTAVDAQGCTFSTSMTVQQPAALNSDIQGQDAACFGTASGSASVTATGGVPPYTFTWQTGQNTAQINHLYAGWYAVEISDAHQCRTNNQIWIGQSPPLDLRTNGRPASCPDVSDGMVTASAAGGVGPYTFVWNTLHTDMTLQQLAPGTYTVTVTDENGCTETATQTVGELPGPTLTLGLDQTVTLGETLLLSAQTNLPGYAIENYTWSSDAGLQQCDDCDQLELVPIADGCVRVRVRDIHGCEALDELCYRVRRERHIYVPNVFHPDGDGENDYFTIYSDASVKEIRYLSVYDRWGEHLFKASGIPTNHDPSGWHGDYRGTPMPPGVYVWVAEVEFIDGELVFLKGDVTLVR